MAPVTQSQCPESNDLRKLLDSSLSNELAHQYMDHMESCTCCQDRLEQLATGGTNLSEVVAHLDAGEPVAESAFWPAVQSLNSGYAKTVVPSSGRSRKGPRLDFLSPASDPAYLGRLDSFDVTRVIGQGGMGIVLEAFDPCLQRHVAIKVLDPEQSDDEIARQRFCREARAAASVTHENVVAVHQVDRMNKDGLPYMVMQLVAGETLEERLSRVNILPVREIVRIAMQAAQGLTAAHAQGLIHGDIKPGNILLEQPNDRVKLTDFGLARVADDVKLTRTGFVTGTPLYMAPEQARGDAADPRSDLFSLGTILYEMSVGKPPFTGNSALAILKQIADVEPQPIRELNPSIPQWLSRTIERLMNKKPEDRYQSAEMLAELLEYEWTLIKATSDEVPQICVIEQARIRKRNRLFGAGIGSLFLCLGLLGGAYFAGRQRIAAELVSTSEPVAELSANAGTVWTVAFDPKSSSVAMGVEDGSIRAWDWPTKSIKSTFAAHRGIVWMSRYSDDGSIMATAGDDGTVKIWNPDQSEPVRTFTNSNAVRGMALAHKDRRLFAGARDGSIRVWSFDDSDKPLVETQQPGAIYTVAISPDDQTLATAGTDKIIRLWNAGNLTQKITLEGHNGSIYGLAFNADGTRLVSAGWDRIIRLWDAGSGMQIKSWLGHEGDIWSIAYSPDGKLLASGGHDGAVKLWNSETGEVLATNLGHKLAVHTLTFSHDGKQLATGGRDGSVRVWNTK